MDIAHVVEHMECELVILGHIQQAISFANKVALEMPQKQTNMGLTPKGSYQLLRSGISFEGKAVRIKIGLPARGCPNFSSFCHIKEDFISFTLSMLP